MPHLVNDTNQNTLLDYLENATKETTGRNGKRTFYAVTCYFDSEAVKTLANNINNALNEVQGQLIGFYVFVDIRDWFKYRGSKDELIQNICELTQLAENAIDFIPINFRNRLFHAKSYALVARKSRKQNRRRKGFVATTSGNLTKRGLGLDDESNIEFVEIANNPTSIEEFITIIEDIEKNNTVSEELLANHDNFLLALQIFSAGSFYHKWEGNLSNEVRFKLTLTNPGIKAFQAKNNPLFANYKNDSKSISRDPINLQRVFNDKPKPFPKRFWATYSIDTLLGRWVPIDIAYLVDDVLKNSVQPYIEEIKSITNSENLRGKIQEIKREVDEFKQNGYIKEEYDDIIHAWLDRIKKFRDNEELITLRIHNYEKVPEILDSSTRRLILKTFSQLRNQINMGSQLRGLKARIDRAITNDRYDIFEQELETLYKEAVETIKKHSQ